MGPLSGRRGVIPTVIGIGGSCRLQAIGNTVLNVLAVLQAGQWTEESLLYRYPVLFTVQPQMQHPVPFGGMLLLLTYMICNSVDFDCALPTVPWVWTPFSVAFGK